MDVMQIANGLPMWIACGIPVVFVVIQAVIFAKGAYNAGRKIGLQDDKMKKAMKSSAVTSIGPSIVVLSSMLSFMGRIDPVECVGVSQQRNGNVLNIKPPAMRVRGVCYTKKSPFRYNEVVQANL